MKSYLKTAIAVTALMAAPFGMVQMAQAGHHNPTTEAAMTSTIVGAAAGNENFKTLVTAVTAADLVDTLNSAGPFTVFAPTDDAFAKIPSETLNSLLLPENKAALQGVLTYHVVAGEVSAATLVAAINNNGGKYSITTVNGETLTAKIWNGAVYLKDANGNKSKIVMTDIDASNGVVHVIDSVVLPG